VLAYLDKAFGRTEPDEEIQELLRKSEGLNLALHYLSGAISFDPAVTTIDPMMASQIVWLDAMLMNVDRTARNTNMLTWNKQLWLIDHGASLYFHHGGGNWAEQAKKPFSAIKDHVLLKQASELDNVDKAFRFILTAEHIHAIVAMIPEEWMEENAFGVSAKEMKTIYARFLINRIESSSIFVNEAAHARKSLI
jgi:hypothetical protein